MRTANIQASMLNRNWHSKSFNVYKFAQDVYFVENVAARFVRLRIIEQGFLQSAVPLKETTK